MSGTIRSRTEAQRDRHRWKSGKYGEKVCRQCGQPWMRHGCPDRVAADDTLTDLNNAAKVKLSIEGQVHLPCRAIYDPDPDSRGAT